MIVPPPVLFLFSLVLIQFPRVLQSNALFPKSSVYVILDYSLTQSASFCFDPTLKKIFVPRHVKFMENVFSFLSFSTSTNPIIDTTSILPASSFPSCNYPALPPIPPSSSELLPSSPTPHPSSRRATSLQPKPQSHMLAFFSYTQ